MVLGAVIKISSCLVCGLLIGFGKKKMGLDSNSLKWYHEPDSVRKTVLGIVKSEGGGNYLIGEMPCDREEEEETLGLKC
jgi:hypothetical protein